MTFLCFLPWGFIVVLLELDEDLDEVSYLVYMKCVIWTCCNLCNGLINFYVRVISCVMCHSNSNKCWSDGVWKCFCDDICDVIWNNFCVIYYDCDFNICGIVTVILNCYVCACPGGVENLIWCCVLCESVTSCDVQVSLIVVFYLDSLLLCDHIHCIQNSVHSGNDV